MYLFSNKNMVFRMSTMLRKTQPPPLPLMDYNSRIRTSSYSWFLSSNVRAFRSRARRASSSFSLGTTSISLSVRPPNEKQDEDSVVLLFRGVVMIYHFLSIDYYTIVVVGRWKEVNWTTVVVKNKRQSLRLQTVVNRVERFHSRICRYNANVWTSRYM